jgi:hypothetical protein
MRKITLALLLLSSPIYADVITVKAESKPFTCNAGYDCLVTGYHEMMIVNDTKYDRVYYWFYSVCADNKHCRNLEGSETVKAHASWNPSFFNLLRTKYAKSSTRFYTTTTAVNGVLKKSSNYITVI